MKKRLALAAGGAAAAALWWRQNPSACPYSQRFWVEAPHPFITRPRLREVLEPMPGERVLEIGPGTGYYTLDLADWVGPEGEIEVFDIQREMLDHTIRRARARGLWNVTPTRGDAQRLPYEDDGFDDGQPGVDHLLVVVEQLDGQVLVTPGSLERRAGAAGLRLERRAGPRLGYFARFSAT